MLFSLLLRQLSAFTLEQNIPRILIAQRTITSPISSMGADSLFFEKFFKERAMPLMLKNDFESKSFNEISNDNEMKHIYKNRRNISERVNGDLEFAKPLDHHSMPKRVTFGILERTKNNFVSEKKKSKKSASKEHPWLRSILFILAIIISACVGYQCGKVHESQNYVRVPTTN